MCQLTDGVLLALGVEGRLRSLSARRCEQFTDSGKCHFISPWVTLIDLEWPWECWPRDLLAAVTRCHESVTSMSTAGVTWRHGMFSCQQYVTGGSYWRHSDVITGPPSTNSVPRRSVFLTACLLTAEFSTDIGWHVFLILLTFSNVSGKPIAIASYKI